MYSTIAIDFLLDFFLISDKLIYIGRNNMAVGITFKDGKCVEAINYYCEVFDLDFPENLIKYSDFDKFSLPDKMKDRIYNSYLEIFGNRIYFYDTTNDDSIEEGNNVRIVIETNPDNLYNTYMNFRKESTVKRQPQRINKKLFTTLVDKYGITWQFIANSEK